jgi:glutaminyl-peptide cyclotransferase
MSKGRPWRLALYAAWQTASLALLVQASPADPGTQACREPTALRFNIVDKITRNEIGFTQGLEVYQDRLYESTGRVGGTTRLNLISFDGKVTRLTDLGTTVFGEGLTILNGEVFQLTWQDHEVFVYDLAGKLKRQMRNPRDGWGLTNDGTDLIFSDGGPSFYYADPRSFGIRKSVQRPIAWLLACTPRILEPPGCVWSARTPEDRWPFCRFHESRLGNAT